MAHLGNNLLNIKLENYERMSLSFGVGQIVF